MSGGSHQQLPLHAQIDSGPQLCDEVSPQREGTKMKGSRPEGSSSSSDSWGGMSRLGLSWWWFSSILQDTRAGVDIILFFYFF